MHEISGRAPMFEERYRIYEEETQRQVDQVKKEWNSRWRSWREELELYCECSKWVKSAPLALRKIKVHAAQDLRKLNRAQHAEAERLSLSLQAHCSTPPAQVLPDLNEAMALALANTFTWSGPSGVLGCTGQRP
jgi:hypothetical protein